MFEPEPSLPNLVRRRAKKSDQSTMQQKLQQLQHNYVAPTHVKAMFSQDDDDDDDEVHAHTKQQQQQTIHETNNILSQIPVPSVVVEKPTLNAFSLMNNNIKRSTNKSTEFYSSSSSSSSSSSASTSRTSDIFTSNFSVHPTDNQSSSVVTISSPPSMSASASSVASLNLAIATAHAKQSLPIVPKIETRPPSTPLPTPRQEQVPLQLTLSNAKVSIRNTGENEKRKVWNKDQNNKTNKQRTPFQISRSNKIETTMSSAGTIKEFDANVFYFFVLFVFVFFFFII